MSAKLLDQQIVHEGSEFSREEFAFILFDVLAILDHAHDRSIRRGTADALLFERFDKGRLGVAWWRIREMLDRRDRVELQYFALFYSGQLVSLLLVILVLFVLAFLVDRKKPVELHD